MDTPNASLVPATATFIFIRGLPGSGKTFLAEKLLPYLGDETVMLDPDKTDYESQAYQDHVAAQIAEGVDPALHAYRFLRAQAYDAIAAAKTIVWNQPFTNLEIFDKMNVRLQEQAIEHGIQLHVVVVEVNVDPELAYSRIESRKSQGGHGPSREVFDRFVRDYRSFAANGYDTVAVDGQDIEAATRAVLQKLAA